MTGDKGKKLYHAETNQRVKITAKIPPLTGQTVYKISAHNMTLKAVKHSGFKPYKPHISVDITIL